MWLKRVVTDRWTAGERGTGSRRPVMKDLLQKKSDFPTNLRRGPILKNDTTATATPGVAIRITRLAVRPRRDWPRAGHDWPSGLLFLKAEREREKSA